MDNSESRPLLPMPFPKPLKKMTDEELTKLLTGKFNYNVLIPGLIEANLRKDKQIEELTKRIATLEKKAPDKPGRPRREFWINGRELTDEYLMQLIDEGYFDSISKFVSFTFVFTHPKPHKNKRNTTFLLYFSHQVLMLVAGLE